MILSIAFVSFVHATENVERYIPHHTSHTSPVSNKIKELVEQYDQFLIDFGQGVTFSQEEINQLFAPNFKKIINRDVIVNGSADLLNSLTQAREAVGNWTMDITCIIPAADGKHCFLYYTLTTTLHGTFDVMALIHFSADWKIDSLDEIAIVIPTQQN